jgi:dihydroflavonol-4-reductase
MRTIDTQKPVLVTGATGYVAGWIIKTLLDKGLTVHAAVRNPNDEKKLSHLREMAQQSTGNIRFFKADLLQAGSFQDAMQDCELVYHTASPFILNVSDVYRDLIDPAQKGTRNVLEQANQTPSVKRVVLTSSCAAIYGDNQDVKNTPKGVFTEEVWNTTSSAAHNPYSYSKTLAEKEAWDIAGKQSRWDLVVINPSLVMGPALNPQVNTSESFRILKQMADGTLKGGVPKAFGIGVVDVREVAFAHYQAGFLPQAKGRHIVSGHDTTFFEMAQTLVPKYGATHPIPRRELPKWLVWLVGPLADKTFTRRTIAGNVGYRFVSDNRKGREQLGISYRPLQETMEEAFAQVVA